VTTIVSEAVIRSPAQTVFDYVTTPRYWLIWHPSSLGLSGVTEHSLQVGEEVTEAFRVAGRKGSVTWRATLREPPWRFAMAGNVVAGGSGTITYVLADAAGATAFRREFNYTMPNAFAALLDRLFVRRRIAAESAAAVARLKHALENTATGAAP
jgi:uncharacterized protein YndB with AHSA1/START domain